MKMHHNVAIEEIIHSDKKLKEAMEWLASMHKQMTEAHQQEARVTEKARAKIANIKESFCNKLANMREDSHVKIHWSWDELASAIEENRWLWDEL